MVPILASMDASSGHTLLRILPLRSLGYELSLDTSIAQNGHSKNSNLCYIGTQK